MFKRLFIKYIVDTFIWRYIRWSKRFYYLKDFKKRQFNSIKENGQLQKDKLYNMVVYAHKNVPYYQEIIKKHNISYKKETIFEDIKKFPILTKKLIRENFEDLKSKGFKGKYRVNTSWWSTGEPVTFLQDNIFLDYAWASTMLFNERCDKKEGEYMIKLRWSEREVLEWSQWINWFLLRNFMNIEILNTFAFTEDDFKRYINIINRKKPAIIEAYVQSIYELAKYIRKEWLFIYSPKGITTSAWTLHDEVRKFIEEVFRCKVFNRYGSREVGDMASDCKEQRGLHINIFMHHIEILDDAFHDVKVWESGNIYVTCLENYVMPLIRYQIGDIWQGSNKMLCSCGRWIPLIASIKWREVNIFKTKDNRKIDGEFFTHLFYFKPWCKQFQVIQEDYNLIRIKIVTIWKSGTYENDRQSIEMDIKKVMWMDCKVVFEALEYIPPTKSGKFLYTISNI